MSRPTEIRRALAALLPDLQPRVAPTVIEYGAGGPAVDRLRYAVTVAAGLVAAGDPVADRLDDLIAGDGVKATLETDRSLGGLVADLNVSKCSGYQVLSTPEGDALGATWTVDIVV